MEGLMGLPGTPELVLYLPWWRRVAVAWSLIWRGRAPIPEMQTAVSLRRRHRAPVLPDIGHPPGA